LTAPASLAPLQRAEAEKKMADEMQARRDQRTKKMEELQTCVGFNASHPALCLLTII